MAGNSVKPDLREQVDRRIEGLSAYQEAIDGFLLTVPLVEPLMGRFSAFHLGPLRITHLTASPRRSERTQGQIARDRHSGISIQLVVAGSAQGEARGLPIASEPGTIMVLDFAQPFVVVDRGPRQVINVSIPRLLLEPQLPELRRLHGRVFDRDESGLMAAYMIALVPRLGRVTAAAVPVLVEHLISLTLLLCGSVPATAADRRLGPAGDRRGGLLAQATQFIDLRLGSRDLSPERVMDNLNISRSDLYSLFRRENGVVRFITRRRLEKAHAALIDPDDGRRIGEIAFACGFASEAHFARAFRSAYRQTAGEVRRTAK